MTRDLKADLKMTKPFVSLAQEAHLNVARASAELEHAFEETLKAFGITATQFNVLRILRGAGSEGLCRAEIGERMIRRVPDVTRLLDRMEQAKWIVRERTGRDRRFVRTLITPAGLAMLDRVEPSVNAEHERLLSHMSSGRLKQLIQLIGEMREGHAD